MLALPDIQAKLRGMGGEAGAIGLAEFAEMNRAEYERFGKLIKAAGEQQSAGGAVDRSGPRLTAPAAGCRR